MGFTPTFPEQDSPFLNLYSQFLSDPSLNFSSGYLDPDDPMYKDYQRLATEPTGSEALIRDYVSRRPSYEEYDPGLGRKMASFLLGALSGGGYGAAQKHLYAPLEHQVEDWEREGTGITSRARLLDAERQRELTAMKFGLQQKARAGREEEINKARTEAEARRLAAETSKERERAHDREFREGVQEDLANARKDRMDFADKVHQDLEAQRAFTNTIRETEEKRREEEEERNRLSDINNELEAYASQRGIQTKIGPGKYRTAYEMATAIAYEDALAHPAFKDLVIKKTKKDTGDLIGYALNPDAEPGRIQALKAYIFNKRQKYLMGEGF